MTDLFSNYYLNSVYIITIVIISNDCKSLKILKTYNLGTFPVFCVYIRKMLKLCDYMFYNYK